MNFGIPKKTLFEFSHIYKFYLKFFLAKTEICLENSGIHFFPKYLTLKLNDGVVFNASR